MEGLGDKEVEALYLRLIELEGPRNIPTYCMLEKLF